MNNLNNGDARLEDASEFSDVKVRMQVYCIPGTRRESEINGIATIVKDYTFVIGDVEGGAPAAASGIVTATGIRHALTECIMKLAETQSEVSQLLQEHAEKIRASQQIITPGLRRV